MQKRLVSLLADLVILAAVVGGGYWAYLNHNQILDWYYLRNYQPPARVAQLADQAAMTDTGRKLFYRADPVIETDRAALAANCRIQNDKTIELGCYLTNDKIYLLNIEEPALNGEMAVTAAHETLHAAYDRMSAAQKRKVNALLEAAAARISSNRLEERLKDYEHLEPGERNNELHSILGTEFANLGPELEAHYAQYFNNRSQIIALSDQFNRTFDGLHAEIVRLDARIKAAKAVMNGYLASGNISAYNALVPAVNADITTYNAKVELYNRYASSLLGTQPAAATQ